jgi:hypothetical protein
MRYQQKALRNQLDAAGKMLWLAVSRQWCTSRSTHYKYTCIYAAMSVASRHFGAKAASKAAVPQHRACCMSSSSNVAATARRQSHRCCSWAMQDYSCEFAHMTAKRVSGSSRSCMKCRSLHQQHNSSSSTSSSVQAALYVKYAYNNTVVQLESHTPQTGLDLTH